MRRIRLVAADLDGTLLDPHGCITARTHAALQRLADAGVTLALATGRRWTGGSVAAASLGFAGPLIHMDGAVIRSYPNGDVLHRSTLDRRFAQRAVHAMFASGIQPIVQYSHADEEYLHVAEEAPNPQWTATYLPAFHQQIRFLPVAELCDVAVDPIRLVALAPLGVLRRVAVDIGAQGCGRQLLLHGNYGTAELTLFESTVSKGNALTILARSLGVPLEETMAIGDGPNDITMLRAAGLGVAMGQAPRRVRAVADALTAANDDDGLARAIERYVFGELSSGGASTYL